jgi:hypothetical protein
VALSQALVYGSDRAWPVTRFLLLALIGAERSPVSCSVETNQTEVERYFLLV